MTQKEIQELSYLAGVINAVSVNTDKVNGQDVLMIKPEAIKNWAKAILDIVNESKS